MEFSRLEHWSGWPFPSSGDLPNPGMKPRSPAPDEPQGKPKNTEVGSLSLLQQIFPTKKRTRVFCIAGGFFTKLSGKPIYNTYIYI